MIARASLLAMLLTAASIAGAAPRLIAGGEIAVGVYERIAPSASRSRTAIASGGEAIFAVHASPDYYDTALFATRFDLAGRLLTPEPIPIVARTETEGASGQYAPRLIAFRGHYILFYTAAADGKLRAVRMTPEGTVVERVSIDLASGAFDVATDGQEIAVVNRGKAVLRLDAALHTIAVMPVTDDRYSAYSRGIAYGDGRFMIVAVEADRVTARVLRDGVLGPAVQLGGGGTDIDTWSRVVWTGSTFAAAWTECDIESYGDPCAAIWTPLTSTGQAAGPLHVLGYSDHFSARDYDITLTAIDGQTLFFTWPEEATAMGRRYRIQGAATGAPVAIGRAPAVAFATPSGALMIVDATQRMAWIEAPASAALPPQLELTTTILAPPGDAVWGAAASATQVAVLRSERTAAGPAVPEVSILGHDGAAVREIRLDAAAGSGSIASDGSDFFVVTATWNAPVLFHDVRTGAQRRIAARGTTPRLVWTGVEFLAVWNDASGLWLARLDRDGAALAPPERLGDASDWLSFTARDGRALLARYSGNVWLVDTLDEHGRRAGPPDEISGANPYGGIGLASNGGLDAVASISSNVPEPLLHVRPRNGIFAPAPNWPKPAGLFSAPAIAPVAGTTRFVTTVRSRNPVLETTNVALTDAQGFPLRTLSFVTGDGSSPVLLDVAPKTILMIYQRTVDDSRHVGVTRTFARVLRVEEEGEEEGRASRGVQRR